MAASTTFTRIPELMNILKFPGTLKLTNIQLKTLLIKFQSKEKNDTKLICSIPARNACHNVDAWFQNFVNGSQSNNGKGNVGGYNVRTIRAF